MRIDEKLAVLMPVFNGGAALLQSIDSCAGATLKPDRYEIIVVDNHSTDGAPQIVRRSTGKGVPVNLITNPENIGRVANWNRALEVALEKGFQYITFLFAGDCWLPGAALERLLSEFADSGASTAFAPFVVAGARGRRASQRFYVKQQTRLCPAEMFLTKLVESGLFPLGPLQANLYRIERCHRPLFDEAMPTRTDVDATLDFIHNSARPVLIGSDPFLEWRDRPGRFHASMGAGQTIQDYMETFQRACARMRPPVDYGKAKACVLLNSVRLMLTGAPPSQWPQLAALIAKCAISTPYRVNMLDFAETLWTRFALGRKLLQFS